MADFYELARYDYYALVVLARGGLVDKKGVNRISTEIHYVMQITQSVWIHYGNMYKESTFLWETVPGPGAESGFDT